MREITMVQPASITPPVIQSSWDSVCVSLLGAHTGPLDGFVPYLLRDVSPVRFAPDTLSGQPVAISDEHPAGTRFLSADEAQKQALTVSSSPAHFPNQAHPKNSAPFSINDLKDIDSLVRALGESLAYAGSISLGNCAQVLDSNRVFDSQNIFRSQEVFYSKDIAYCSIVKYSEGVFGSESVGGHSRFVIKGFETYDSCRVMESVIAYRSSDLLYTANCDQCQDCLFSFNQRGARRLIGNRPLPPDEFKALKAKLISEMRDELAARHALPSIVELIASGDS